MMIWKCQNQWRDMEKKAPQIANTLYFIFNILFLCSWFIECYLFRRRIWQNENNNSKTTKMQKGAEEKKHLRLSSLDWGIFRAESHLIAFAWVDHKTKRREKSFRSSWYLTGNFVCSWRSSTYRCILASIFYCQSISIIVYILRTQTF